MARKPKPTEEECNREADSYVRAVGWKPKDEFKKQLIEYRDVDAAPIKVQVPLWEAVERIKRIKVDPWQRHLCDTLQAAAENRHIERAWAIIHAQAQLGKTTILSQVYPAWLFGHDPLHRFALAMYNVTRSQLHSAVVIQILQSLVYKDIFPNTDGWIYADFETDSTVARSTSKAGWKTNARRELNDGQLSMNPVGLQSGLTGSGFDTLSMDDPYRESKEAFSEQIRENMTNMWEYTIEPRAGLHSNIFGMFHRYHVEDLAGFLLDTGDFEYVRYAAIADGDYTHESTGNCYPDPLGRKVGEFISPRFGADYYAKSKKNNRVWLSMFQGRPSSEEGEFFNIGKLTLCENPLVALQECTATVRSYDSAVSVEDSAAYSVGAKMGIRPNGKIVVFDLWRDRVDTAGRLNKQKELAFTDGAETVITVPIDPGAAGRDVVWYIQQALQDYTVIGRATSGSKEQRALNFSNAVNSGDVEIVEADWNTDLKRELRDFPLSDYKDIVDALSDGYNQLFEMARRGLVIKNLKPQRNFVYLERFIEKFPYRTNGDLRPAVGPPQLRLPAKWTVYAGVKIQPETSKASSAVIVARASHHSGLQDDLFVIDEYKTYDADFYKLFEWLDKTLKRICSETEITIWLHPESEQYHATINEKLNYEVAVFKDRDASAGLTELNWYLLPTEAANPFNDFEKAAHLYFLMDQAQYVAAVPDIPHGFYHARQEVATWGYNENAEPTKVAEVMDCLRMVTHLFRTYAEELTPQEEYKVEVLKRFKPRVNELTGKMMLTKQEQQGLEFAQQFAAAEIKRKHGRGALEDDLDDDEDEPELNEFDDDEDDSYLWR